MQNEITYLTNKFLSYKTQPQEKSSDESLSEFLAFQRVRQLIIAAPESLKLSKWDFAVKCQCSPHQIESIFKRVNQWPEAATKESVYPGIFFQQCEYMLQTYSQPKNYLQHIFRKQTANVMHKMTAIIVGQFAHGGTHHRAFPPRSKDMPANYIFPGDFKCMNLLDLFLVLFQDNSIFYEDAVDVTHKISQVSRQPVDSCVLDNLLKTLFVGEAGELWPARKLRAIEAGHKEITRRADPYYPEVSQYYDDLKIEIIETIRCRFLGHYLTRTHKTLISPRATFKDYSRAWNTNARRADHFPCDQTHYRRPVSRQSENVNLGYKLPNE